MVSAIKKALVGALALVLTFSLTPFAYAAQLDWSHFDESGLVPGVSCVEDALVVGFADGCTREQADGIIAAHGLKAYCYIVAGNFESGSFVGVTIPEGSKLSEVALALEAEPLVNTVEPDYIYAMSGGNVADTPYHEKMGWSDVKPGVDCAADRIIIGFKNDTRKSPDETLQFVLRETGMTVDRVISWTDEFEGGRIVSLTLPEGMDVFEAIDTVAMWRYNFDYIEPDWIYTLSTGETFDGVALQAQSAAPNDYDADQQWYLGQVGIDEAWDVSRVNGNVEVAVLDSGVETTHPDLAANLDLANAWDVQNNQALTGDIHGHGTWVTGVLAATADNSFGLAGVSYNAKVVPINIGFRIPNDDGVYAYSSRMSDAITYVLGRGISNLRVINISYAGSDVQEYANSSLAATIHIARQCGVLVVVSAGNDGTNATRYPSDEPEAISVIATDQDNQRATSSNYGIAKDISAPGVQIYTTGIEGTYGTVSGTSFAAPIVSGVLAMMFACDPTLSVDDAEEILEETALDLGATGFDAQFGWGLVDAEAALQEVADRSGKTSISGATVAGVPPSYYYQATQIRPSVTVTLGTTPLLSGTDYEVLYGPNLQYGSTGTVTVRGVGSYYGFVDQTFQILSRWTRLWGATGYETGAAVAAEAFPNGTDTVILARYDDFRDALCAAGIAGAEDAAVLLTNSNELKPATSAAIQSLGASHAIVIGGTAAVSQDVVDDIEDLGLTVERVSGSTAQETAVAVYNRESSEWGDTCVIATLSSYYDALSASPYCYAEKAPLFFVTGAGNLSASEIQAIQNGGFSRVVVCGGPSAVPDSALSQLTGMQIERVAGATAFGTSSAFATFCLDEGMTLDGVGVATFSDWRDAATSSMLLGQVEAPLLIASNNNTSALTAVLQPNASQVDSGYIFGGTSAVSTLIETYVNNITAH